MSAFFDIFRSENSLSIGSKYVTEVLIGLKRQITRQIFDFTLSTDCISAGFERSVNGAVVAGKRIQTGSTDIAFHFHKVRNDVNQVAACVNNRVESYTVLVSERFANGVDAHYPHHGSV